MKGFIFPKIISNKKCQGVHLPVLTRAVCENILNMIENRKKNSKFIFEIKTQI